MLQDKDAVANLAVKTMDAAREFYEGTLGLQLIDSMGDDMVAYRSGTTTLNVYRSDFAGTNKATAVTWAVGDEIERVVRELKAKGVAFEHYDLPDMQRDGDLHIGDGMKVAWFKDPDGNILNIVTG
jgi:catechol 2,3-dioxygenase-like lactoylglutathione lyase family enzyme